MLALLLASPAFATCAVERTPTAEGVFVSVRALEEPVGCRTVTLQSDGPLTVQALAWTPEGRKRRLPADHLRMLPGGGWEIGDPELDVGGRLDLTVGVSGGELSVQLAPAGDPIVTNARLDETRRLDLDTKHPGWGFADPTRARTVVEQKYTFAPDAPAQVLPLPQGAAEVDTGGLAVVPLGVRVPAGTASVTVRYTLPGAAAQGDERRPPGSLTLLGTGVTWVGAATPVDGGVRFDTPDGGSVRWRVATAGNDAVIPDTRTFVAGLDWRFARVSLPEPAVPMTIRGRRDRPALLGELVREARGLRAGTLPGAAALSPRQLNKAWKSGWATSVERGLILHRFLGQEKFPATWVLTGEDADPETLTGFDTMLIVTGIEKNDAPTRWIDPACTVCAEGEIGTRWLGKPAIGGFDRVPPAAGRLTRALALRGEQFEASFTATGAAALWLRERLVGVEPAARPGRLATALGMEGGTLVSTSGFETAGADITLTLTSSRPPHDPFPTADTPWSGGWADADSP